MLTTEKKIRILRKMRWLNFKENFLKIRFRVGLCTIFDYASDFRHPYSLSEAIPEIKNFKTNHLSIYWWTTEGRFLPWWERHKAINKTINLLKKSL